MSFFDDDEDDAIDEEPRAVPRTAGAPRSRGGGGSSRSGSRGGPPRRGSDPAVERRRLVAIAAVVVVVILVILLISSCQARNTRNSLEDYNNSVSSLITKSDRTGAQVFRILGAGGGGSAISQNLAAPLQAAQSQLSQAQSLGVPGQMAQAQAHVLLALQMRVDGIKSIATAVPQVGSNSTATNEAIRMMAAATARFYASDVVYKNYATTSIARALHGDNINVSSFTINGGQFLPSLGWLNESFIATELGATYSAGSNGGSGGATGQNSTTPGLHGDAISAVSVGSTTLQSGVTNTVPASPAPTFQVAVTDGGTFNQYHITCSVAVSGGPSGKTTLAEVTPGNSGTCDVKLSGPVTPGQYQVTVSISKVPLETNLTNNTATYTVSFS